MMTEERLAELARHAEQAPPEPWYAEPGKYQWVARTAAGRRLAETNYVGDGEHDEAIMALMAAAPELLKAVIELRAVATLARRVCTVLKQEDGAMSNWDTPSHYEELKEAGDMLYGALVAAGIEP